MAQEPRTLNWVATLATLAGLVLPLSGCPAPASRPDASTAATPASFNQGSSVVRPGTPPPGTPPSGAVPPGDAPPSTSTPVTPRPSRTNHLSPATRSLVAQARTLSAHGDLDGASATLDRALRIEPHNPLLWIERGKLRLVEGDAHQAEGCARKALALASGDRATQAQAGRLLADTLLQQGRNPEASEVERQPFMQ